MFGGVVLPHAGREGPCSSAPGSVQARKFACVRRRCCLSHSPLQQSGCHMGRHGSREIIYTFTGHACNNAATAMPGAWTQRPVRDSEKSCDQSAHSAHIGSWCSHAPSCLRRGGLHPRCPQAQAHPTCALRAAQSSAAAAPVPAAYRGDTRCDLYVISTCQSRRRLMAHS